MWNCKNYIKYNEKCPWNYVEYKICSTHYVIKCNNCGMKR